MKEARHKTISVILVQAKLINGEQNQNTVCLDGALTKRSMRNILGQWKYPVLFVAGVKCVFNFQNSSNSTLKSIKLTDNYHYNYIIIVNYNSIKKGVGKSYGFETFHVLVIDCRLKSTHLFLHITR